MKTVYLYDEKTKEFKNEVNAQLDPLESEKAGKDIYLLPANATWEQPAAELPSRKRSIKFGRVKVVLPSPAP